MAKTTEKTPAWTAVLAAMCPLFRGISAADIEELLDQLNGRRKQLSKGESFMRVGDKADKFAVVLSGSLVIVAYGPDGRRNIVEHVDAMRPVALAQAFSPERTMRVGVEADEEASILLLRVDRVVSPQDKPSAAHLRLMHNLTAALAAKTLQLNLKISILSHRSTSDRLMAYLRYVAAETGSSEFDIPFDRQELADFLCVERSALSAEIGRLARLGVLSSRKRHFSLLKSL